MTLRRTLTRSLAAATVAVLAAACGSTAGPSAATTGDAAGSGTTAAGSTSGGATVPGPGRSESAPPPPPTAPGRTVPTARGQVLHGVTVDTGFTAQVVSANTSAALPGIAAPTGRTTLLVRLKVASDPADRTVNAPNHQALVVKFPGCDPLRDCFTADDGARAVPEGDVREGVHMNSVPDWFGKLDANTAYYKYVWQFVPEGADLSAAQLCSKRIGNQQDVCVPLGPVEPLNGQVDRADLESR
ncbi:hypothetical protein [Kitasatospora sp. NPDC056181]|uniref:hypothetical protein n=1 Tax=Kitasatospora sp. NPDC056181 TaxID=3345737 RepID=UPI0035DC2776